MHLTDFFGGFHPKAAECIFLLSAHRTFSRIHHVLGHKKSLNKFKEIEIILSIFSDHNGMKLEINHKKKSKKHAKTRRLNNMLLSNEWVNNEIKEEIKRYLETNENEDTPTQIYGTQILHRGKFIALQAYLKKQEKSQINNLTLHLKVLEKEQHTITMPKVSRRKEIYIY